MIREILDAQRENQNLQPINKLNFSFKDTNTKYRLRTILIECVLNRTNQSQNNFPKKIDDKSFPLKIWQGSKDTLARLIDPINSVLEPDFIDNFDNHNMRVGDCSKFKEYLAGEKKKFFSTWESYQKKTNINGELAFNPNGGKPETMHFVFDKVGEPPKLLGGLKRYKEFKQKDYPGTEVITWDDFLEEISGCGWYGPFVHEKRDSSCQLDHFYCFSINQTGDNSYYVVLEVDLREFYEEVGQDKKIKNKKKEHQMISFWTRYRGYSILPVKRFLFDQDPEGWRSDLRT